MAEHDSENYIKKIDYQTRYRLYEKSYDNDSNLIALNSTEVNKAIRYFGGMLLGALLAAFSYQNSNPIWFNAIWILSGSAIIANVVAYPFSQLSLKIHRDDYAERYYLQCNHAYRHEKHRTYYVSLVLEYLSMGFFIGAMLLFALGFLTHNIIIKGGA